jgi:hypothetical protein
VGVAAVGGVLVGVLVGPPGVGVDVDGGGVLDGARVLVATRVGVRVDVCVGVKVLVGVYVGWLPAP